MNSSLGLANGVVIINNYNSNWKLEFNNEKLSS